MCCSVEARKCDRLYLPRHVLCVKCLGGVKEMCQLDTSWFLRHIHSLWDWSRILISSIASCYILGFLVVICDRLLRVLVSNFIKNCTTFLRFHLRLSAILSNFLLRPLQVTFWKLSKFVSEILSSVFHAILPSFLLEFCMNFVSLFLRGYFIRSCEICFQDPFSLSWHHVKSVSGILSSALLTILPSSLLKSCMNFWKLSSLFTAIVPGYDLGKFSSEILSRALPATLLSSLYESWNELWKLIKLLSCDLVKYFESDQPKLFQFSSLKIFKFCF